MPAVPCARPPPRSRVLNKWVSRFDLWPYLERFTIDATKEILAEMVGGLGRRWVGGNRSPDIPMCFLLGAASVAE